MNRIAYMFCTGDCKCLKSNEKERAETELVKEEHKIGDDEKSYHILELFVHAC